MGLADSFGQYLCVTFITAWMFLVLGIKLLKTIDDTGEGRKSANERFAEWLRRRFG